jgi:hypothetical protein
VNLLVVCDISGSMQGKKIEMLKSGLTELIDKLTRTFAGRGEEERRNSRREEGGEGGE